MAAPVAIQLAGAMVAGGGSATSPTPKTPTSPSSPGFPVVKTPSPFVNMNVREVFESHGVDQTMELSKRVNLDIEKKREELRTLVGERYRDLIDAADTIQSMSTNSATIFEKLAALRQQMSSLPNQLNSSPKVVPQDSNNSLNKDELEIAFELKLALEAPRVVQKYLDEMKIIPATHISLLFDRSLCQNNKPFKWTFLSQSTENPSETAKSIKNSILQSCDDAVEDFNTSPTALAECIAVKQVLTNCSCSEVIGELLAKRIKMSEQNLQTKSSSAFVKNVANTLHDIYLMFIDGQLYNTAVKEIRKPRIHINSFGIKYTPKVVESFTNSIVPVEESPRAGQLAQLLLTSYVHPLQSLLRRCFENKHYLLQQQSFQELTDYQKCTTDVLKEKTEDLMRIVLGTSKSLWVEAFYPVFQEKCEQVGRVKIETIFSFLNEEAFPKYKKLDEDFDLVSYIWKASALNGINPVGTTGSSGRDVDLKLRCISPQVADMCSEIEERYLNLFKDFQTLGDFTLKKYISQKIKEEWVKFLEETSEKSASLFLGRFVSSLVDLCPTIWKLIDTKDGAELRTLLSTVSEKCWTQWATEIAEKFNKNLAMKMTQCDLKGSSVFMPMAEEYTPETEDTVKPSIRVPLQISHLLHSSLFLVCNDLSRVGSQSIPKSVRENFRQTVGSAVMSIYKDVIEKSEDPLSPQIALQLIFDIKFCQWFHLQLKELADPVIKQLQGVIDPFDMDIVTPRLKINLKRFLFETHLTLGLLFSEESHSFIAQNFKTKMNMSYPSLNISLTSPLPLLPV